jgi:hypothetical protein
MPLPDDIWYVAERNWLTSDAAGVPAAGED